MAGESTATQLPGTDRGTPSTPERARTAVVDRVVPSPAGLGSLSSRRTLPVSQVALVVLVAALGLAGTTTIVATAPVWRLAAPSWRLVLPGVPHPGPPLFSAVTFLAGLVLLGLGWIGLVRVAERYPAPEPTRRRLVLGVALLWAVPVLLGPPLLSHDVYSYAAQGELASRGIDPTATGPFALPRGDFLRATDPVWRTASAPYGPVAIASAEAVVLLSGHDAALSVWGFRLLAVVGLVLSGVGITSIARSRGIDPAVALALGLANPVVLLHLLGGGHNDALMMGLLLVGVAAALRQRWGWALVLMVAATAVKLPAVVGLVFLGWLRLGPTTVWTQRLREVARTLVGATALLGALCLAAGIGVGWVLALRSTGKSFGTLSVTTQVGLVLSDLGEAAGLTSGDDALVGLARLVGLAAAAGLTLFFLFRADDLGLPRALGLSLLAIVLLGPVVWPWYLPVGFALLAATSFGRSRASWMVVVLVASGVVFPESVGSVRRLQEFQAPLTLLLLVVIGVVAWAAPRVGWWWSRWRGGRPVGVLPATMPGLPVER
jgi:hypothetical protein